MVLRTGFLSLSGNFEYGEVFFIDKITLFPTASALFGNECLISYRYNVDLSDPRVKNTPTESAAKESGVNRRSENVSGLMYILRPTATSAPASAM